MALTVAELERQMRPLLENCATVERMADGWNLWRPEGTVIVRYRSLLSSRLGSLELPQLDVSICVNGDVADERSPFVADFLRHLGRGGG